VSGEHVAKIDGAEIDAPAGEGGLVVHGRMQLVSREQDDAAWRHDQADGRFQLGGRNFSCGGANANGVARL